MTLNRRLILLLCALLIAGPLWAEAEAPSPKDRFEQAAALFSGGRTGEAEALWKPLREDLMNSRSTAEETALLADTERALGRISLLRADYPSAYEWYVSAYIWYKSLYGEKDGRTLSTRLSLIQLEGEQLEMEEQALRDASGILSLDPPALYRDIARILSFSVYVRMNSRKGTERLLPDVLALSEKADDTSRNSHPSALPGDFRPSDVCPLACQALADYYIDLDQPEEALRFAQRALSLIREDPFARAEDQIPLLIRAGFIRMYFFGETEGCARLDEAVRIARSVWAEGAEYARVCALAGEMYRQAGEYPRYFDALSRALQAAEASVGENHPLTAEICLLLSPWYRITGDYRQALTLCERSVRIQLSYLKDDTAMLGSSYNHLANCRADMGDWQGAAEALQKSIGIYGKLENTLQTAVAERNLALILNNGLNEHDQALSHLRSAILLADRLEQDCRPETAAAIYMLSADLLTPEDPEYGRVEEYLEKAEKCLKNAASRAEMEWADYHILSGRYQAKAGKYREAFEHLLEAKALYEALYRDETAYPVNIFYDIADCLRQMKDKDAADWYFSAVSFAEKRMEALQKQGIDDTAYLLSTRDNALHYLREWEKKGHSW